MLSQAVGQVSLPPPKCTHQRCCDTACTRSVTTYCGACNVTTACLPLCATYGEGRSEHRASQAQDGHSKRQLYRKGLLGDGWCCSHRQQGKTPRACSTYMYYRIKGGRAPLFRIIARLLLSVCLRARLKNLPRSTLRAHWAKEVEKGTTQVEPHLGSGAQPVPHPATRNVKGGREGQIFLLLRGSDLSPGSV